MNATPLTLDAADTWPSLGAFITKGSFVYFLVVLACTCSHRVMKKTEKKNEQPATGMEVKTNSIGIHTPHRITAENSARHGRNG